MAKLVYYPWLTQNVPAKDIADNIGIYAREIENQLTAAGATETVEVMPPVDVPQQVEQVVNGSADIALMNPLGFVFARSRSANAEAVAVAKRIIDGQVGVSYFAQLYAHKKTAIKTFKDIKSIGFGVAFSTSNFLVPALMIRQAKIHPLLGFERVQFLGGHDVVARAVYNGVVDVGAGHDGVIIDLSGQRGYGDAQDVLVRLDKGRSEPIPSDPVVVTTPDPARRDVLKRAIVAAGNTEAGLKAMGIFWGKAQGLQETTTEAYAVLSEALRILKLDQADLMPG
jgi:ABC-type phosphate/phosphonate transport system substrate-binding protein